MSSGRPLKALSGLVKGNRLYLIMLAVVIALNLVSLSGPDGEGQSAPAGKKAFMAQKRELLTQERIEEIMAGNKVLSFVLKASSFLLTLTLFFGLVLSARSLISGLSGQGLMESYGAPAPVDWNFLDVCKIAIIFYFFGYAIQILEAGTFLAFAVKEPDERLLSVANTLALDAIGICAVLHFVINRYSRRLSSLGVSFRNFFRDVWLGFAGYVAALPLLLSLFLLIIYVLKLLRYEPPSPPLFEIFYEEGRAGVLSMLTVMVAFFGPVAEELFFRGFAYPVFKRRFGMKMAVALSSFVFALLHMNPVGFVPIMVLGAVLAYLYERTGSLIAPIIVHMTHNMIIVYFIYLSKAIMAAG